MCDLVVRMNFSCSVCYWSACQVQIRWCHCWTASFRRWAVLLKINTTKKKSVKGLNPGVISDDVSRLSMIVQMNVVLNTTVVDSDWRLDNLWGSHLPSQSELYHISWWYQTLVIDLVGKLSHDVMVDCQWSRDVIGYEHLMTMMTTVYDDSMTMTLKEKLTHSIYLLFWACSCFSFAITAWSLGWTWWH